MDTHSHLTAPNRSRSSQSPSPSHSASASATSSIHKRKRAAAAAASDDHLPPLAPSSFSADTRDARLETTAGVSAAGGSGRNAKIKMENTNVKIENSDSGKDGGHTGTGAVGPAAAGSSAPGIVVKEDSVKIFTENLQTSGAYSAREENLKKEEEAGRLKFVCYSNDGIDEHMNIFARQLPNMPKEYIVRLLMDRSHKSVMVIRHSLVVGGITYRPYISTLYLSVMISSLKPRVLMLLVVLITPFPLPNHSQKFGEIAFCAITADEQVKGYGTRLMNHLKQHARDVDGLTHFLTYADNNAVGYFIKQGFTKEIKLEKDRWHGYIKDYDGGILMECKIDQKLPYTDLSTMIRRQRLAIDEKIRELSNCHIIYPGIDFQKKEAGIPKKIIKIEDIPESFATLGTYLLGREAGWAPDQWGHSRFKTLNSSKDSGTNQKHLITFMRSLLKASPILFSIVNLCKEVIFSAIVNILWALALANPNPLHIGFASMHDHVDAWPFKEPVDACDVPDYYDIIKDPMDLKTMSKRVESEQYYVTLEMFIADVKRMCANARWKPISKAKSNQASNQKMCHDVSNGFTCCNVSHGFTL
ncbi:hypothetical protein SADUNF_Sadunf02G0038200 [Salix dunnii]|uniref:Histone acetyltransferase n=1 Tax=Salix dunnii TaxID=1413687 RepID=A0A835N5Z1_9ROSI|nr:hypothetical protein SADUNF_Sadunf02G0038200 [Salix dunnii]